MYCKVCGFQNPEEALYCQRDGVALHPRQERFQYTAGTSAFCTVCGTDNATHRVYCTNCGNSLLKPTAAGSELEQRMSTAAGSLSSVTPPSLAGIANGLNADVLKRALPGALVSAGVLMVISFLFASMISNDLQNLLGSFLRSEMGMPSFFAQFIEINSRMLLLFSNFVGYQARLSAEIFGGEAFSGYVRFRIGLYPALLLPLLGLMAGGFFTARRNPENSLSDKLLLSLGSGILYAVFLILLSLITRDSISAREFGEMLDIRMSFSILGSLVNGLFLGTAFSLFGMVLVPGTVSRLRLGEGGVFFEPVWQAFLTLFRGYVAAAAIMMLYLLVYSEGEVMEAKTFLLVIGSHAGAYFWNLLHLGSLQMTISDGFSSETLRASLLRGFEDLALMGNMFEDFRFFGLLSALAAIALFLWAGKKIGESGHGNPLHQVGVFAGAYAVMMTFLAYLTSFRMNAGGNLMADMMGGDMRIVFGFRLLPLLISSLILAGGLGYAGTFLAKKQ